MTEPTIKDLASYIRESAGLGNDGTDDEVVQYAASQNPEIKKIADTIKPKESFIGGLIKGITGAVAPKPEPSFTRPFDEINATPTAELRETPATDTGILGMGKDILKNVAVIPAAVEAYKTAPLEGSGKLEAGMSVLGNLLGYVGSGSGVSKGLGAIEKNVLKSPEVVNVEMQKSKDIVKQLVKTFETKPLNTPVTNRIVNFFKPDKLAEKNVGRFWARNSQTGQNWQKAAEILSEARPDAVVNATEFASSLNAKAGFLPELRTIIDSNAVLKTIADNPEAAAKLSLKETQDIINHINKYIPSGVKSGVKITPFDIPKIQMVSELKHNLLKAFPEAKDVAELYGKDKQVFNKLVRFFTDVDKAEAGLRKGYNPKDTKSLDKMIKQYFDKDTIKEIGGYKTIYKQVEFIKKYWVPAAIGTAATGYFLGRK